MPKRVVGRLARVDDDRQPQLARQRDLRAEDLLLHVARREVVVIVEPDLADGARAVAAATPRRTASTRAVDAGRRTPRPGAGGCRREPDRRPQRAARARAARRLRRRRPPTGCTARPSGRRRAPGRRPPSRSAANARRPGDSGSRSWHVLAAHGSGRAVRYLTRVPGGTS